MNLPTHVLDSIERHGKEFLKDLEPDTKADLAKAFVNILEDLAECTDNKIDDAVVAQIASALGVAE